MPFDFNKGSARISMLFPAYATPVELSVYGWCQMACFFCFANLNRNAHDRAGHVDNQTQKHLRFLENALHNERNGVGYFLRHKYPVAFSNTTDPFQREEKRYRASEAVLAWMQANQIPVMVLTRGNVLHEEFERYKPLIDPGRVMVYISITHQDDNMRRKAEPGAMGISKRWELARMLSGAGVPVMVAINPYLREWVPDPEKFCEDAIAAGARLIHVDLLHFTDAQAKKIPAVYSQYVRKANLADPYFRKEILRWRAAGAACGIDIRVTPQWETFLGSMPEHAHGIDPEWLGGKVWALPQTTLKAIVDMSAEEGDALVMVRWANVVRMLEQMEVPNDTVSPAQFIASYTNVSDEFREMRRTLGSAAPIYEILRYYWNHPECGHWFAYAWTCRIVGDNEDGQEEYDRDENGDIVAVIQSSWREGGVVTQSLLDDHDNVIMLDS